MVVEERVSPMSEQDGTQATALQPLTTADPEAWQVYWEAQGQPWRTEPEIDAERQKYLAEHRNISPNIEQGIYPFKDIRLARADVEWLLACHYKEHGSLEHRIGAHARGLDLRGADLRSINLSRLPLHQLRGGLGSNEWRTSSEEQREAAAIHLERASLDRADLQWASLRFGHLEGADLRYAHLEGATLRATHLVGNNVDSPPADLRYALFDQETVLEGIILGSEQYGSAYLADVRWSGVNLAVVNWKQVKTLGDEHEARQKRHDRKVKDRARRLNEYEQAVRANRQLAIALQSQGLNEYAARFAYRAQLLQRIVLRRQRKLVSYLFSGFLDLIAGYGYRPGRTVLWYLSVIVGFAVAYFAFGHLPPFPDALVFSLMSFHGRGFFPSLSSETSLHNQVVEIAAIEAVVGLLIEISFIATFTQRYFGK